MLCIPPGYALPPHQGTSTVFDGPTNHLYTDWLLGHPLAAFLHILYTRLVIQALVLVYYIWISGGQLDFDCLHWLVLGEYKNQF
jgi:hypothetical protein